MTRGFATGLTLLGLLTAACAREAPVTEAQGDCGTVFTGRVCTWSHSRGDSLVDVGATVPLASIENSPADAQMAWPPVAEAKLKLPAAVHAGSGLSQLTMYWEPMGHPPVAFQTPHFDFHFYVVPPGDELGYDCTNRTKPAALPADYLLPDEAMPPEVAKMIGVDTLIGICVPQMGMHSLPSADYALTTAFRGDMVIGYYAGKPIFIEPMLSKAMLMEKKSFDLPIPVIPGYAGVYPRTFRAEFDEQQQSYRFVFSGFARGG